MKRQNGVYLFGTLQAWRVLIPDGVNELFAVEMIVATDVEAYGGHHPVVAYGRQAAEVIAFVETWDQAVKSDCVSGPLYLAVEGWLHSRDERTVVVADGVHFAVPDGVRAEAKILLNHLLHGLRERPMTRVDGNRNEEGGRGLSI